MNSTGSIIINRRIRNHWLWKDPVKLQWWIDLLMEVNYKPGHFNVDGKLISCGRGQSVNSLHTWACRWNTGRNKARTFLRLLESDKMISIESLRRTTRITVLNYNMYQKSMAQLKDYDTGNYKDALPNPDPTSKKKLTQLIPCESKSCRDDRPNLGNNSAPNRSNEEVFNQENSSEKTSINIKNKSVENVDEKFQLFLESDDAEKLRHKTDKQTPYDATH